MFRGSYEAKITEGRLKLPTDFERLVTAANIKQFYVTSPNGNSAEIWPLSEWEKREARLAEYNTDPVVKKYLNFTSYYGQQSEIDKQARLSLPKILRGAAKLEGEVLVMGKINYLEVTNLQMLAQTLSASAVSDADLDRISDVLKPRSGAGIP
ncbi:MAG: division/cell wall cluster transcriptional repressor MraZ [Terracidiphilus sp.]|jgi:MraZ protein